MSERCVPISRPMWESLLKSCGLRRQEWEQLRGVKYPEKDGFYHTDG
ncbi:hypothetical protein [Dictyobacter kobayashii]|uniref:Uncharacterized protein n=1 Tax=Dictyobacter kobayashii TaxID=2014872 RepID=A0A402ASE7_9CHLR|nr:hypothetical protein [Dictyobacter kobayashii]GCE22020.1 hypothetical protein KDK_58200 [Dictyobacter kobayashii]